MDKRWRLDGDALEACGLQVALQRIAATHWRAQGTLRSWALAPLHREGDTLCVPCGDGEVLWLGAWPEPVGGAGAVWLQEPASGLGARIAVPAAGAITSLAGREPIARLAGGTSHELCLGLSGRDGLPVELTVSLMAPPAWTALSGRPWQPLGEEPPRPRRLG